MKPETRLELKKFWQTHLLQWKESRLSQSNYCKKNNIKVHRFSYWKRKLTARTNILPSDKSGFVQLPAIRVHPTPDISTLTLQLPNKLQIKGITYDNLDLTKQLAGMLQ